MFPRKEKAECVCVCVCLRCGPLAFEAALVVCRQNTGQRVGEKKGSECRKTRREDKLRSGKCAVFVEERSAVFDFSTS